MLHQEPQERLQIIGKDIPKVDGREKVTGSAQYLSDLRLPRMLVGKILRSRYSHARLKSIDVSRALRVRRVVAITTGYDTKLAKIGFMKDNPPLKVSKVRSTNDEVAAVAAENEDAALEAVERIEVDYEPLEPLFDIQKARQKDAPLIHEESGNNVIPLPFNFEAGKCEEVMQAGVTVEEEFRLQYVSSAALETIGDIGASG